MAPIIENGGQVFYRTSLHCCFCCCFSSTSSHIDSFGEETHRSDVSVSVHRIRRLGRLHSQACCPGGGSIPQKNSEISVVNPAASTVYLHLYPQSLLNGCLPGEHKSSDTLGFTKVKNSLRFGVKNLQNLLFNYCPYASIEFLFQIKQELGLQIWFAGLYLTRRRK